MGMRDTSSMCMCILLGAASAPIVRYARQPVSLIVPATTNKACVPSTAFHKREVLRVAPIDSWAARVVLLWPPCTSSGKPAEVTTSVHASMMLHKLGQRSLEHLWWQRAVRLQDTL